jgi:hypothetical protein
MGSLFPEEMKQVGVTNGMMKFVGRSITKQL